MGNRNQSFGPLVAPTVTPVDSDEELFDTLVSDMQTGLSVSGGAITGTLKYLDDPTNPIVAVWGAGNFMALQFSDIESNLTSVKVGLNPSQGSGLAEILTDPDKNGVFKVTNKNTQDFVMELRAAGSQRKTVTYELSGLTLEDS